MIEISCDLIWLALGSLFGSILSFLFGYALGKMDRLQGKAQEDHPGFWRESNQ